MLCKILYERDTDSDYRLGLAYSGSAREDLQGLLIPLVEDVNIPMEVAGIAGLALGMIFVGTANAEITQSIVTALMERDEASLNVTQSRFLCLGLGLLYLGKQALADVTIETLKTLTHPIGKYAVVTVDSCAYTGIKFTHTFVLKTLEYFVCLLFLFLTVTPCVVSRFSVQ